MGTYVKPFKMLCIFNTFLPAFMCDLRVGSLVCPHHSEPTTPMPRTGTTNTTRTTLALLRAQCHQRKRLWLLLHYEVFIFNRTF